LNAIRRGGPKAAGNYSPSQIHLLSLTPLLAWLKDKLEGTKNCTVPAHELDSSRIMESITFYDRWE
jgi:hypothetical protein